MKLPLILGITCIVAWWLSGYDSKLTGDDKRADFWRRITRCVITLFLVALGAGGALSNGRFGGFIYLAVVLPLAILWVGCASELFARGFHTLIDSPGATDFDPQKLATELDRVAALFGQGRNQEAIALCTKLVKSCDASTLAMETMLFRLYDQAFAEERILLSPVLAEVRQLSSGGRFAEAESRLNLLLEKEPDNLTVVMLLLRLYAQSSGRADKAMALLRESENRPGAPPFFVDYAQQRVREWLAPRPAAEQGSDGIESLLVDTRHLGQPKQNQDSSTPPSLPGSGPGRV